MEIQDPSGNTDVFVTLKVPVIKSTHITHKYTQEHTYNTHKHRYTETYTQTMHTYIQRHTDTQRQTDAHTRRNETRAYKQKHRHTQTH